MNDIWVAICNLMKLIVLHRYVPLVKDISRDLININNDRPITLIFDLININSYRTITLIPVKMLSAKYFVVCTIKSEWERNYLVFECTNHCNSLESCTIINAVSTEV